MAEEFQAAGICGETWWNNWNPTRTMFAGCNSPLFSDNSTLQIMGFGLSSSTTTSDWNQSLLRSNGRSTECYDSILEEDHMSFKPVNQEFPMGSSTLLQSFFGDDEHQEQAVFNNYMSSSSSSSSSSATYIAPSVSPPLTKQQQLPAAGSLHFSNNTSFWNATATGVNEVKGTGFLPPSSFEEKPNCSTKTNIEKVRNSESEIKKGSDEAPVKRPRLETPSPLPTFKVRKEKLGDRVTALQQLVSPFGKTDTASVLHEAIEYIKFLHDQVNVLSTPYMKQAAASIQQQVTGKLKDQQDLRSRGLCLVPVSSTFPVTNETPADFWTPTFGGTFR